MLSDEQGILDSVRERLMRILPDIAAAVFHSADNQWTWTLQVSSAGGLARYLYWGSGQWWVTQVHSAGGNPAISVVEPISSASDETRAVDRGVVIALAAVGSSALDRITGSAANYQLEDDDQQSALVAFGAALNALENIQDDESGDAETRSLARTLRGEWLITRLDDLGG
ncbi:hypothetical protein [Leifsonia soli]|uniref:Uncharacterized protein n=1 Tax=Leifsonia soli TaxID=582665 RepID=A0A852T5M3_9MICO|nr:hypothetical protein [Leifsonia soli]NYD76103.1 hypothetical protein [Leifsonia soli]